MAWNLLQSSIVDPDPGSATNFAKVFPSNVKMGSLLIVTARAGAIGRTASATDTQGNTWFVAINSPQTTDGHEGFILYAIASTSGPCTVTVTISGAASTIRGCMVVEWSNASRVGTLNTQVAGQADATSSYDSGTLTTTIPDTLIIAYGTNANNSTITAGANFTLIAVTPAAANTARAGIAYRIVHSAGAYNGLLTNNSPMSLACGAAAFTQGPEGPIRINTVRPAIFKPGIAR